MFIDFTKDINDEDELKNYLSDIGLKLPEYRCAVIGLIFDEKGRILLQRRGPKSRDEFNKLEDIGGAVESTDISFKAAMHREIVEEVAEEWRAETRLPRIQQAFHICKSVIKFGKQRTVLMIKVHSENCYFSKREKIIAIKNKHHNADCAAASEPTVSVV